MEKGISTPIARTMPHADLAEADRIVDSAQKAQDRALADAESKEQDASRARDQLSMLFSEEGRGPGAARRSASPRQRDATWKDRAVGPLFKLRRPARRLVMRW